MSQLDPTGHRRLLGMVANLTQSLIGAITPNFRAVSFELATPTIRLNFLLEQDSAADREEIEDIVFEYEALELGMPNPCEVVAAGIVSQLPEALTRLPGYRVFGRKE
jgi:hypothetical protein